MMTKDVWPGQSMTVLRETEVTRRLKIVIDDCLWTVWAEDVYMDKDIPKYWLWIWTLKEFKTGNINYSVNSNGMS